MAKYSISKKARPGAVFISAFVCLLFSYSPAIAGANQEKESKISINIAWERIQYNEQEPDSHMDAEAELDHPVIGIEAVRKWKALLLGTRLTVPIAKIDGREEASISGRPRQENTLQMGWTRIDGFAGYSLRSWIEPYVGLRWSEVVQERGNFVVAGVPVTSESVEEIRSWSLLIGMGGSGNLSPRWAWNYRAELFLPLDVKVTNTALPGFESSDKHGYTVELKGGMDYSFTDSLSSGFFLYAGRMHWDGSAWLPCDDGRAKWPENDTRYFGAGLNILYKF